MRRAIEIVASSRLGLESFAMESPKQYDFDALNIPPHILQALGLVAASSAYAESIVEMAIGGCLGVEVHYGAAITTHMSHPLRDHALRSVAQIRIDDLDTLDKLDEILDNINAAFKKRNLYLHGLIGRDPETNECFIAKIESRGELSSELVPASVNQIKIDANVIRQAGLELVQFMNLIGLAPRFPERPVYRGHKTKAARKKRRKEGLRGSKA
jgi:hypothetical protein